MFKKYCVLIMINYSIIQKSEYVLTMKTNFLIFK